jgi:hypothetical protein
MGAALQASDEPASAEAARLAARLIEFNLHAAHFAHRSWYPDAAWARALFSGLTSGASARRKFATMCALSRWLLGELDVAGEWDWQMAEPQKRLWLLDTVALTSLARDIALAMHRDWLALWIDGERVRRLLTRLPRAALCFVLQEIPAGCLHYRVPLVNFESDTRFELEEKLQCAGARTLMALLPAHWRAVRRRAQLHFDKSYQLDAVQPLAGADYERALDLICGKVLPKRAPEWAWLF